MSLYTKVLIVLTRKPDVYSALVKKVTSLYGRYARVQAGAGMVGSGLHQKEISLFHWP
jgi:uroporphyrinogen-III decarboxylase